MNEINIGRDILRGLMGGTVVALLVMGFIHATPQGRVGIVFIGFWVWGIWAMWRDVFKDDGERRPPMTRGGRHDVDWYLKNKVQCYKCSIFFEKALENCPGCNSPVQHPLYDSKGRRADLTKKAEKPPKKEIFVRYPNMEGEDKRVHRTDS